MDERGWCTNEEEAPGLRLQWKSECEGELQTEESALLGAHLIYAPTLEGGARAAFEFERQGSLRLESGSGTARTTPQTRGAAIRASIDLCVPMPG